jgi:hypothetical protein
MRWTGRSDEPRPASTLLPGVRIDSARGRLFATHLHEEGQDIRTIQELHRHRDLKTTMFDTHVLNRGPLGARSPLDRLPFA